MILIIKIYYEMVPYCLQLDAHKAFTHIAYGLWQGVLVIYFIFFFLVTHISYNQNCDQSCSSRIFLDFVEMTFRLVHAMYNLPDWQAVNLTVFTPC